MVFRLGRTGKVSGNVYVVRTLVSNFFIYSNYEAAVCFNSGFIPCVINRELDKIDIKPESISNVFITYPHFYNMGGIKLFKNSNIYIPSKVFDKKLKHMEVIKKKNKTTYIRVKDGDVLNIGNIRVKAIVFPGHKKGAIAYMVNDSILFI
ncbi:MBL fold metallo-hydrolase [Clostridium sp.]|jgi:glyoxylase-like metal-dependent hydrolase (beta-lactamase superfamily II)|uniref:MBL fold metallo-hydrolase n=1 Tax=Clostridium sp. TaxID=1506 RepID=UPI002FDECCA5